MDETGPEWTIIIGIACELLETSSRVLLRVVPNARRLRIPSLPISGAGYVMHAIYQPCISSRILGVPPWDEAGP